MRKNSKISHRRQRRSAHRRYRLVCPNCHSHATLSGGWVSCRCGYEGAL